MPKTPPPFVTSAELCARAGIDRSTLSRWVDKGRITPAQRLPGLRGPMLFNPLDVDRLVDELAPQEQPA